MSWKYKPSTMLSNAELEEQLERLKAEVKADRKARGVPPEPPADFVPIAMAWTLFERCKPLINFAIEYARLVDGSDEIIELTEKQSEWLDQFKIYTKLITKTDDTLLKVAGAGLVGIVNAITNQSSYETATEYLRTIYYCVELTRSDYRAYVLSDFTYDHKKDNAENTKFYDEVLAEVERLKDDDYFEQELERLTEHYQEIKHLY